MTDSIGSTRRDFLKTSAVAAGVALSANVVASRMAYAAGSDELKIGLVGAGGRGSGATAQALNTSNAVSLVAVADAFEDKAKSAVDRFKKDRPGQIAATAATTFSGFDAYKKVLDQKLDMVILATPPGFRPMHFEAAVQAGKNIFMEKPVGSDAPGIRRLLAANEEAKKKNLKVGVGLQRHHQQKYIDTIKKIHDGEIGDIVLLRVYWNGTRPWVRKRTEGMTEMEFQMRNWYYFTWLCGDHICEQHIHNLDVANWVMKGPPVEAQGAGGRQLPFGSDQGEIFDHHMLEYTYASGAKMLSMCRHQPGCWNAVSEYAHGTKGTADISGGRITFNDGRPEWKYQAAPGEGGKKGRGGDPDPYQVEHDTLAAAIRNNTPYNEGDYGASSSMTAILGRMATYSGQVVKYSDALERGEELMPRDYKWDGATPVKPGADGLYACAMPGKTQVLAAKKA
ncbi:Gfo/Idh/MocA family protein [Humisphaera borealis]|uniref:Gfo/Idh/MocA family oxidoreductase n=1 Tax=Humisphaera borealis TaxID=2807512 RepID=A0A7M2WZ61_9BACT|nr:Gfo/Idh/MocA family oxidoreductase [Humisphaera borealis]QOV90141.1 Gfo/Idh/MocA family oxidoreductase [Humisphaera borealis]